MFAVCSCAGRGLFFAFNGTEELATFFAAVVDEGVYVLLEVFNCFLHFGVEGFGSPETLDEIVEGCEYLAVFGHDGAALAGEGVVFGLFGADAFVLEEIAIGSCQLLH